MECVSISNISIDGFTTPLFMRLGSRGRLYRPNAPARPVGVFRDVSVDNLVATNVGNMCSAITGIPGHSLERISLSNIVIQCKGGIGKDFTDLAVPEIESAYPGSGMFGDLPAYGFYCRHIKDFTLLNVRVGFNEPDMRYGLVCDKIENLTLNTFHPMVSQQMPFAALFTDVHNAFVVGCNPPEMKAFVRLRGDCREINQDGNNFSRVRDPFVQIQ